MHKKTYSDHWFCQANAYVIVTNFSIAVIKIKERHLLSVFILFYMYFNVEYTSVVYDALCESDAAFVET